MGGNSNCLRYFNFREIDFWIGIFFLIIVIIKKGFYIFKEVQDIIESSPTEQR